MFAKVHKNIVSVFFENHYKLVGQTCNSANAAVSNKNYICLAVSLAALSITIERKHGQEYFNTNVRF